MRRRSFRSRAANASQLSTQRKHQRTTLAPILISTSPAKSSHNRWTAEKSAHAPTEKHGGVPMRTIIHFAENRDFDNETDQILADASENAWEYMTARGERFAVPLKAALSREVLAKRIIELAQRGERDSIRLCDDALAYLREQSAEGRRGGSAR